MRESRMIMKITYVCSWLLISSLVILSGCTTPSPLQQHLSGGPLQECARFFVALNKVVRDAEAEDPVEAHIAGFPYLRVNRFLSSFRNDSMDGSTFEVWVDRLQSLDRMARRFELLNLPPERLDELQTQIPVGKTALSTIAFCGDALRRADIVDPESRTALRQRATVADEYVTAQRILGIYPLTSLFFLYGIGGLHDETRETFARPLEELSQAGMLLRYVPPVEQLPLGTSEEIAAILQRSANNPFGIPEPTMQDLERLFATFAPIWEVDVTGASDQIGTPTWREETIPVIDINNPVMYQHISHTRVNQKVLLQLNYVVWFPERPSTGMFDLLGGHLDGITWRVTLTPEGRPLLYDSMHNCGCYHMFFPTPYLTLETSEETYEPPLLPQMGPEQIDVSRIVIRVAPLTHYIERVYADNLTKSGLGPETVYRVGDYNELRALPTRGGRHRSLFRPDGIITGSERAERWLFWPMGIPAPGAMRAWGHHATAFIGRRHFDDPDLIERLFNVSFNPSPPVD